jgi:hypothetical protein
MAKHSNITWVKRMAIRQLAKDGWHEDAIAWVLGLHQSGVHNYLVWHGPNAKVWPERRINIPLTVLGPRARKLVLEFSTEPESQGGLVKVLPELKASNLID